MNLKTNPLKAVIAWMCQNKVAAMILMLFFLVGGLIVGSRIKQEILPEFTLDIVTVSVLYPGASPEEVERGIILSIEDQVRSLDGVKKVTAQAFEGIGKVYVELLKSAKPNKTLQDIKNRVDSILSFPQEAEKPIVSLVETRKQVISLLIYGNQERALLRKVAEKVRDDLLLLPNITFVELDAVAPLEIHVEVPQEQLRRHNLTLGDVADRIRKTALELPGGGVKTTTGEVLLRTKERRDFSQDFLDIPIVINADGTETQLEEIATVTEGTEETHEQAYFNGQPAIRVNIYRAADQKPIDISETVNRYAETFREKNPEEISIATWHDRAEELKQRQQLLLKNASLGLFLVLLLLGLFLEARLAFWVALGMPIAIIGSFIFIPLTGASINMISLFAFILTLGIIVDDAVVVGENVYQKLEEGHSDLKAATEGTQEIATPVIFAVLTNIIAFVPILFVPGVLGKLYLQIPAIVIVIFFISLIESLFVLPSHLSHKKKERKIWRLLDKPSIWFERLLHFHINHFYAPILKKAMKMRYLTVVINVGMLLLTLGIVAGGFVAFSFFPKIDAENIVVQAFLPYGVPLKKAHQLQTHLTKSAQEVLNKVDSKPISHGIYTQIGTPIKIDQSFTGIDQSKGSHIVGAQIHLIPSKNRTISGREFASQWREAVGEIPGIDHIKFVAVLGDPGESAIDVQLSHRSTAVTEKAAEELALILKEYDGVKDIDSGVSLGKPQLDFKLSSEALALGLKTKDLAEQVRFSFYGAEALRQQRGRDEIKILVRLPQKERKTLNTLEELIIRSPNQGEIPFREAATVIPGRAYSNIKRVDGKRVTNVTAEVEQEITNANDVLNSLSEDVLPKLLEKYPGLTYSFEGEERVRLESVDVLKVGFTIALVAIYALLAIAFSSYFQPLIIMTSIPFGIIGAIFGHLLLGYQLTIVSLFGIIALSGVVVNDSLVLITTINRRRKELKETAEKAVFSGSLTRFRPIILTSLTTFFGLMPMILETDPQARFLVPMAISLGFGILFATFIILLLVPALYLIEEDIKTMHKTRH